jgi:hypothetical protein
MRFRDVFTIAFCQSVIEVAVNLEHCCEVPRSAGPTAKQFDSEGQRVLLVILLCAEKTGNLSSSDGRRVATSQWARMAVRVI